MGKIKLKSLKIHVPSKEEVWKYNLSFLSQQFLSLTFVYEIEEGNVFGKLLKRIYPEFFYKLTYSPVIPRNPPSRKQALAISGFFSAVTYSPFTDDVEARQVYNLLRRTGIKFEYLNRREVRRNFKCMVEEEMGNVERVTGERFEEIPSVKLVRAEKFYDRIFRYKPTYEGPIYISPYIRTLTNPFGKEILIPDRDIVVDRPTYKKITQAETMMKIYSGTKFNLPPHRYYNWEKHELLNSLFEELVHALHSQKRGEWGRKATGVMEKGMTVNISESLAQIAKEKGLKQSEPERRLDVFTHALRFWTSRNSFSTYRAMLALSERYPLMNIGMLDWIDYFEIYNPLVTRLLVSGGARIRVGVSPRSKHRVEMVKDILGH